MNVSLHLLLLLLQIFLASKLTTGEGSHVGYLIKTKSGKVFLRRSSKKAISRKKDAKEGGQHDSDDKESKDLLGSSSVDYYGKPKRWKSRKSKKYGSQHKKYLSQK